MIVNLIFNLLGGLGLFFFGMRSMSEAMQVLAGDRLRRIISFVTDNRVLGVGTGLLTTIIVQSSTVTTVMTVSFVHAGVMSLAQGASVVLGANIGTTITGWILVLKIHKFALPILGLGIFAQIFSKRERLKYLGTLAMGFGMIFFGLSLMKEGFAPLKDMPEFTQMLARFGSETLGSRLMTVLTATVLTMIMQSSSVMLGVTIALASVGLINFHTAAALILGENIGTTITAELAAIGTTRDSRRVARIHTLVNVVGVLIVFFLFSYWIDAVDAIMPGDPDAFNAAGERSHITAHISMAHTGFNVFIVLLWLPLLRWLVGFSGRIVREDKKVHTSLKFLHANVVEAPPLAMEQGRQEVFHMADVAREMLGLTRELFSDMRNSHVGIKDRISKLEKITDVIQHEITLFMTQVMSGTLTIAQSQEIRMLIRLADEIESVADYCERMANYRSRAMKEGVAFSEGALKDVQDYLDSTIAFYDEIIAHAKAGETAWLPDVQAKGTRLTEVADEIRDRHLARLEKGECDPTAGIFFSDVVVAMRRIRNHSYNMAEAFLGRK